ncbi:uncharacterized protein LOC135221701 [Macrobrachium nipponense]|uniref:uncharacterized protein LOC135221701 n=1 Tax=Macrobrachium nipponense TaxID=159736 RepID=UPI0030C8B6F1
MKVSQIATVLFVFGGLGCVCPTDTIYGPNFFARAICEKSPLGFKTCLKRADLCRNAFSPSTLPEFRDAAEKCTQIIGAIMPEVGKAFVLQRDNSTTDLVQAILADPSLWADYMSCITSTNHGWLNGDAKVVGVTGGMRAWLEAWASVRIGSEEHDLVQDVITAIQECPEETDAALTTCLVRACVKV